MSEDVVKGAMISIGRELYIHTMGNGCLCRCYVQCTCIASQPSVGRWVQHFSVRSLYHHQPSTAQLFPRLELKQSPARLSPGGCWASEKLLSLTPSKVTTGSDIGLGRCCSNAEERREREKERKKNFFFQRPLNSPRAAPVFSTARL